MTVRGALRVARWIATAVFFAAGYRLAFWHHEDPLVLLLATPAFWTLISAWAAMSVIWIIERRQ